MLTNYSAVTEDCLFLSTEDSFVTSLELKSTYFAVIKKCVGHSKHPAASQRKPT